jgi:4-hydroxythreonine-4-phosphate dehydrogenase
MSEAPVRLAISAGDPGGIGPEVLAKALANMDRSGMKLAVFGPERVLADEYAKAGLTMDQLETVDVPLDASGWQAGKASKAGGTAARLALAAAVAHVKAGLSDALVTLPIDKATIYSEAFPYAGHTEYLAEEWATPVLMLMVHEPVGLRVGLVTSHVPLSEVSALVTHERVLDRLRQLFQTLRQDFGIAAPRMAVLGLNPHAGDEGLLGTEEISSIIPALKQAVAEGMDVRGPYAADGFFQYQRYREVDGVLTMYHDQGLAPFKAIAGGRGVNFTAGLPIVRTSPDHGTAYDLVGKNVADFRSTADAIELAVSLVRRRRTNSTKR